MFCSPAFLLCWLSGKSAPKPELFDSGAQLQVLFLLTSAEMCYQNQLSDLMERAQHCGVAIKEREVASAGCVISAAINAEG